MVSMSPREGESLLVMLRGSCETCDEEGCMMEKVFCDFGCVRLV